MSRRRRDRLDAYEEAAARLEGRRRGRDVGIPGGVIGDLDVRLPRLRTRPLLVAFVIAAVAFVVIGSLSSRPPELAADCTTPALRLSQEQARPDAPVRWAIAGPATGRFVLTLDVAAVTVGADGAPRYQPRPGAAAAQAKPLTPVVSPAGCRADGIFVTGASPGEHTVTLFRLTGVGGTEVASRPLTVLGP